MQSINYSNISVIYDYLMRGINYKKWAHYIEAITKLDDNTKINNILELASGTGKLASNLSVRYKNYVVSDLSPFMLKQFNQTAKIKSVCCNMTSLPFKTKFDFIFSTFDSVNYLRTKKSILRLLNEVAEILSVDGVFTFDVTLENNSLHFQKLLNRKGIYKGVNFVQTSNYNTLTRLHTNKFTLKLGPNKTITETHKQKIYHFNEYFRLIDKSDLYVQHCFNTFSFNDADAESERVQFILRKKIL